MLGNVEMQMARARPALIVWTHGDAHSRARAPAQAAADSSCAVVSSNRRREIMSSRMGGEGSHEVRCGCLLTSKERGSIRSVSVHPRAGSG